MKRVENDCVGCTDVGLPCMGSGCPNWQVTHFYCDECGDENNLYHFDGKELCLDCIEKSLEKVEE